MYCHQRHSRYARMMQPDDVFRWCKRLLFHLRWDYGGPRGESIRFEQAVRLSGLTTEMIEEVLQHDIHTGRFFTWTERGIAYLQARKSKRATGSSEPQVVETAPESQCVICYEDITYLDITITPCKHTFCAKCAWFMGSRCAYCRQDRAPNMYHDWARGSPDGFDDSSDGEYFSQRRYDDLFGGPSQMLQIECPYCDTSWSGWNCVFCGRTH